MSAKEKAEELIGKFADVQKYTSLTLIAKNCALICVDEILESLPLDNQNDIWAFWEDVKNEIEKL